MTISRVRAELIAGEMVEDNARLVCNDKTRREASLETDLGLGSRALRSRRSVRSVRVPSRPPCSFGGDVEPRQGTPTAMRGSTAAREMTPAMDDSFKAARGSASALARGDADGRKGRRKVRIAKPDVGRRLHGQLQVSRCHEGIHSSLLWWEIEGNCREQSRDPRTNDCP